MPPKARKGVESSRAALELPPPPTDVPPQGRSRTVQGTSAGEGRLGSQLFVEIPFQEGVEASLSADETVPPRRDEHRRERPRKDKAVAVDETRRDRPPAAGGDVAAQDALLQKQERLVRELQQLQQQLRATRTASLRQVSEPQGKKRDAPSRAAQPPSEDLRNHLDQKRSQVRDEGSSNSRSHHSRDGRTHSRRSPSHPKRKPRAQTPEKDDEQERFDKRVRLALQHNLDMRDQKQICGHTDLGGSPFTKEIERTPLPRKFSVPRFVPYDGLSNPSAHLRHFSQKMSIWGNEGHLNCKIFSSSLGDLPLKWFCSLPEQSVSSWKELQLSFLKKFQAYTVVPKKEGDLIALRMKQGETLAKFTQRFWAVYSQIEGAREGIAIYAFQHALIPGIDLRKDLVGDTPESMPELMSRVKRFIAREEDEIRARDQDGHPEPEQKSSQPRQGGGRPSQKQEPEQAWVSSSAKPSSSRSGGTWKPRPPSSASQSVNVVFKEPTYRILTKIRSKPFFKYPPPMLNEPTSGARSKLYCSFHRDNGHRTEDCNSLQWYLEKLAEEGHIPEFVEAGDAGGSEGRVHQSAAQVPDSEDSEKIIT